MYPVPGFSWLLDVIVCAVPRLILAVNNKRAYFWKKIDSTPNSMPDSMLGTEGQGATTAASPLGVFAKEDET